MQTDIRSLQLLEKDLLAAAEVEASPGKRIAAERRALRWKGFAGAAAAVLAVAFVVGSIAGGASSEQSAAPAAGSFSPAGSGVAGDEEQNKSVGQHGDALGGYASAPSAKPVPGSGPVNAATNPTGGEGPDLSKIIRDGKIAVVVEDGGFRQARNSVTDIADGAGGMVLSSSVDSRTGTFVLRIPAAHFDDVMVAIGNLGHVDSEEENGQDVTADRRPRLPRSPRAGRPGCMGRGDAYPPP
jgi:hypothetical protein